MKPSPFEYVRPANLAKALEELSKDPDESKLIAGGQSLVPMMNFRLARPERLIDIARISEIAGIRDDGERTCIGATTKHIEMQNNNLGGPLGSLLRSAAARIGHLPIRTRGTFGGSIAHCDAASEWCVIAVLLDAEMTVQSHARGSRTISSRDFFQSTFTTALELDEILTEVSVPRLSDRYVTGLAEFARRAGDFAIATVAAAVELGEGDVVKDSRISIGGVGEIPFRSRAAEAMLLGETWSHSLVAEAANAAARELDPPSDAHASAEYRRDLVRALLPRALSR